VKNYSGDGLMSGENNDEVTKDTNSTVTEEVSNTDVEVKPHEEATDKTKQSGNTRKSKPDKPFPNYNIEEALKIAIAIKKNNAGNPWSPENIADAIGQYSF
jgi:hypothetical protein